MQEGLEILPNVFVWDSLFMDYKIMIVTAIISIILFLVGIFIHLDKWGRGIPEGATKPIGAWGAVKLIVSRIFEKGIGHALEVLVLDVLLQRRIYRRRKLEWLMHILIFWGWIGLLILTIVSFLAEFYGPLAGYDYTFYVGAWNMLELPNDIFGYMLAAGVAIAIVRRLTFKGTDIQARNADIDWIFIIGILIVVVTGFYAQYLRVEEFQVVDRNLISEYPEGFFNNITVMFHEVFTLLFCVAYLPFSKYFHMITAPLTLLVNHGGE